MTSNAAKWKLRLTRVALIIGGLLLGGIVAEVALRIGGYSYPIFYQTDAERGYAPIPNVEGWFWVETKNYVKINSAGFRDREHSKEKPANTLRIAVIGDSFSEARQVSMGDAFWSVMEREIQNRAPEGRKIEVLNFGVGGYGTVEELLTLRQRVWEYSPDIVLLAVCTYNDITDNYRPFKNADELPYFKIVDGVLVFDGSFLESKKYRYHASALFKAWVAAHNHSRLLQLLHHAQYISRERISAWKASRRTAEAEQTSTETPVETKPAKTTADLTGVLGIQNMVYREPDNPDWTLAWQLTEALIIQIRNEVKAHGAQFMMTTISTDIQVYPDPKVRQSMIDQLAVPDLFYPDRRLHDLAVRENIPFLDLAEPMQRAADRDKIFFHGFGKEIGNGHWNEAGHKFAGDLLAEEIGQKVFTLSP